MRNDTESAWIIVEGSRSRKLDFPNICSLFHRFPKYMKLLFARQCYWFISFVILVNESDFPSPAPTRFSPPDFLFLWILFLTKYDKVMSQDELKFALKEVFCKRSRIKWNTRQDWSGFLDIAKAFIWFRVEVNSFQTDKSSVQVSAVP